MGIGGIIDSELELAETAILEGGLVGKHLANKLAGYSSNSMYIYKLANKGTIQSWHIGGQVYFSAIDCMMFRRKRATIRAYAKDHGLPTLDPASEPRQ